MWDDRYGTDEYVYGTEPNDFLAGVVDEIPVGDTLCLGEGEGRNGVFLAQRGHRVLAVDLSPVGLEKARRLAGLRGVEIGTRVEDLAEFSPGAERWDCIVSIFCHLPPEIRTALHARVVEGLRPGGCLVLEAYTPRQLEFDSGGPPVASMMMSREILETELAGLEVRINRELDREVREGRLHHGTGAVVQFLGRKPDADSA